MATLDNRLLPLIETLTASGADWLAFEIIDGLREGRVAEETPEKLQIAQSAVRSGNTAKRQSEERALPVPPPEPIVGDDQIDWAAEYINKRLSDVVFMLQATLDQLDEILIRGLSPEAGSTDSIEQQAVTLALKNEDEVLNVWRGDAAAAIAALPKLHEVLRAWVTSTRSNNLSK